MSNGPEVLYEQQDRVAVITLNRPERNNSQTEAMESQLLGALTLADDDDNVKAVILTGAGRHFCVGGDLKFAERVVAAGGWSTEIPHPQETYALRVRKPVVAAINGGCAGMGLVYALTCDVRFAASTAKLSTAFVRRGLAAERGISWYLEQVVGHAHALELLLSGRAINANEAERIGLVNRTVPAEALMDVAMTWAQDVAVSCSAQAMESVKHQMYREPNNNLITSLSEAAILCAQATRRPDFAEGMRSYAERRTPEWEPLGPSPLRGHGGSYREGDYEE